MVIDGYYTYPGDEFVMYINVKSLCCTSETNIILYVNYISINNLKELYACAYLEISKC